MTIENIICLCHKINHEETVEIKQANSYVEHIPEVLPHAAEYMFRGCKQLRKQDFVLKKNVLYVASDKYSLLITSDISCDRLNNESCCKARGFSCPARQ